MLVGTTLRNRYTITAVLGSGGFGDTYLAVDRDLPGSPKCVVKQLKPKDTSPGVLPIAKSLFEREAEYLYKLGRAHPQIPELFAHFEEGEDFYLVEEFVDGHNLTVEIPPEQRLSEHEVIHLLLEILEVLAFVHQNNVIHRDIKLQNLMRRNRDGKIMLIDFGSVKDISVLGIDSQGKTSATVSIGSPGYMPSEQAKGKPRLSSDVYAVGIIGIQALTGLQPDQFPEDSNTGEIVWRDRAQVSDALANVLQTMVHYHFSQRYKSAVEALQALNAIASSSSQHDASTVIGSSPDIAYMPPAQPVVPIATAPDTLIPTAQPPSYPPSYPPTPVTSSQSNTVPVTPPSFYPPNPQTYDAQTQPQSFQSSQPSSSNSSVFIGAMIGAGLVTLGAVGFWVVPKLLPNSGQSIQTTNQNRNTDIPTQKTPTSTDIPKSPTPKPTLGTTPSPDASQDWSTIFNHIKDTNLSQKACVDNAGAALKRAGFTEHLEFIGSGAFAANGRYSASIRCVTNNKIVFFAVAGPQNDTARALVVKLHQAF
ncbi:serine/threonine-protein kinase [Tumidithrix elongata RA019]|uniref:non-specific serine/threonine protein kinase n=1 Tax=Tumidithrix elongata BACA0141 TaxID=2716417 RepID=A0AAW9Q7V4_9CYAN|nr:serine/threonine-protein kinase [Tumidithrix elongata RA019]